MPFSERLVVSVNFSDTGNLPILLQLDSGSDGPILYAGKKELERIRLSNASCLAASFSGAPDV